jgi:peptide deformylase
VPTRDVLRYPHPGLKRVCADVGPGVEAARVARDLVDTMRAFPRCVGLAAPQIGEEVRIVVVDVTDHPRTSTSNGLLVLVDPVVVATPGGEVGREGCLSIPEFTANVPRATRVAVRATTPDGRLVEVECEGFEARAVQHELDHLDGILFLDRIATSADLFPRRRPSRG